jgi:hypothetical protein
MRALSSSIGAAVINDDHLVGQTSCETFTHNAGNRFFFIQRGDND